MRIKPKPGASIWSVWVTNEAYLNGKKISDHVLDPGWTAYGKEARYVTHDVTSLRCARVTIRWVLCSGEWLVEPASPSRSLAGGTSENMSKPGGLA